MVRIDPKVDSMKRVEPQRINVVVIFKVIVVRIVMHVVVIFKVVVRAFE